MGLGIVLYGLAKIVFFIVFPIVWATTTARAIIVDKKNGYALGRREYAYAILKGFVYGVTALLLIALIIFIWLYFFVDLSIS